MYLNSKLLFCWMLLFNMTLSMKEDYKTYEWTDNGTSTMTDRQISEQKIEADYKTYGWTIEVEKSYINYFQKYYAKKDIDNGELADLAIENLSDYVIYGTGVANTNNYRFLINTLTQTVKIVEVQYIPGIKVRMYVRTYGTYVCTKSDFSIKEFLDFPVFFVNVVGEEYYQYDTTLCHINSIYENKQFRLNYSNCDPKNTHPITIRQLFPELKTKYSVAAKSLYLHKQKLHLTNSKMGRMDVTNQFKL